MIQPKWVSCSDKSAGIKVQVPDTDCLECGKCNEAIQAWLRRLPKVNLSDSEAEDMLTRKEHKKGLCPRVRNRAVQCNASKKLCPYAWLCSDNNPRKKFTIMLKEEHMFLVQDKEGKITQSKATTLKTVAIDSTVAKVFETRQQLVGAWSLVPVTKENKDSDIKIPKNIAGKAKFLVHDGKRFHADIMDSLQGIVDLISKADQARAYLIANEYKPMYEIKLAPIATRTRDAKKS